MPYYNLMKAVLSDLSMIRQLLTGLALSFCLILAACGGDGDGGDPVKPKPIPDILQFSIQPLDILPGDSSLVTYKTTRATAVTLNPGGVNLAPIDSGQVYVKPPIPTQYSLIATNANGRDSAGVQISMSGAVPLINSLTATDSVILSNDSTILSWTMTRADSIRITGGGGMISILATSDSSAYVRLPLPTVFLAVAYNDIANDTATFALDVELPASIDAPNGMYYKGFMGNSSLNPELRFWTLDNASRVLTLPWMIFQIQTGDGTLSVDSIQGGTAKPTYTFDGVMGNAMIRALVRGVDSVDVNLRASTIKTGAGTQGQYVVLNDTYGVIKALNGPANQIDVDPNFWFTYAVYEQTLGVVLVLEDNDQDEMADDNEPAFEIILTQIFPDTTIDGLGIGSTVSEYEPVFGLPDSTWFEPEDPPDYPAAYGLRYSTLGMTNYSDTTAARAIIEMHLYEPDPPPGPTPAAKTAGLPKKAGTTRYRPVQSSNERR